jgi:small subunit ribosomal protein S7
MPRHGPAPIREVIPDPVFDSRLVSRFVNSLFREGKKTKAETIFYGTMQRIAERTGRDPLSTLEQAMRNVMPTLEVRPRRVGGSTYQVPMEVRAARRVALGIRWLLDAARRRPGKSMQERLAAEIMDAGNASGAAVKKREDTHRMADVNKAFAHYRW